MESRSRVPSRAVESRTEQLNPGQMGKRKRRRLFSTAFEMLRFSRAGGQSRFSSGFSTKKWEIGLQRWRSAHDFRCFKGEAEQLQMKKPKAVPSEMFHVTEAAAFGFLHIFFRADHGDTAPVMGDTAPVMAILRRSWARLCRSWKLLCR